MHFKKMFPLVLSALPLMHAAADSVKLSTTLAEGQKITLGAGGGSAVYVVWPDGSREQLPTDGQPAEITIKSQSFSVESAGLLRYLYAPHAGLSAINTLSATHLEALYLAGNELTGINVMPLTELRTLDVQGNRLTSLTLSSYCPRLESLNCAYNQLKNLSLGRKPALTTVICAGNAISSLTLSNLPALRVLWCQDNALTKLDLGAVPALTDVYAYNNALTSVSNAGADLVRLWVDHNQLADLSVVGAAQLQELAADHNQLHDITLSPRGKKKLSYFYANDNALSFNSFPTTTDLQAAVLSPQAGYVWPEVPVVGEAFDVSEPFEKNAWNVDAESQVSWHDAATGAPLVAGTDYTADGASVTFLKPLPQVYAQATSSLYPGLTIRTAPVAVATESGIGGTTAAAGLTVSADRGTLIVNAGRPSRLQVYSAGGAKVIDTTVPAGRSSYSLPAGAYVAGGTKVLIP